MKYIKKFDKAILESNSNFEGLTFQEITDSVKNGTIKINPNGHNSITFTSDKPMHFNSNIDSNKYFTDLIIRMNKDGIDIYERNKNKKDADVYEKIRDRKFKVGERLSASMFGDTCTCHDCDDRLFPYLQDENTIAFISLDDIEKANVRNGNKYTDKILLDDISPCKASTLDINDKLVAEINVPSGELVICNNFKTKEIYEMEEFNSINAIIGRYELMQYLAKKDIGYGQMGNMSIDVYLKNDGTEVIFANSYDEESDTEREYPGYKHLGDISFGVWRWMCADKKTLNKYNEKPSKDSIITNVKPGKWVIEHYYDVVGDRSDGIYTKLYLKK